MVGSRERLQAARKEKVSDEVQGTPIHVPPRRDGSALIRIHAGDEILFGCFPVNCGIWAQVSFRGGPATYFHVLRDTTERSLRTCEGWPPLLARLVQNMQQAWTYIRMGALSSSPSGLKSAGLSCCTEDPAMSRVSCCAVFVRGRSGGGPKGAATERVVK